MPLRPLRRLAIGSVLLVFLALGAAGILRHEMWRDELEIWLIARDSASLGELLANMGIQGHPALWYLIVFALTRVSGDPLSMQVLHLAIGAGAATLFLAFAPFGRAQRILFCFGYFTLYEFTIISRSYGLELLLIFLFCALFGKRRSLHPVLAVILVLLAHTNVYGTIIATALGATLAFAVLADRRREGLAVDWTHASSLAVCAAGIVTAVVHVARQARRVGRSHTYAPTWDLEWLGDGLSTVLYGYVPVPDWTDPHFWNTSFVDALPGDLGIWTGMALSLLLLLASLAWLWPAPRALALFLLGTAPMLVMFFFLWYGQLRHHAQIWVLFLACCWLSPSLQADGDGGPAHAGPGGAVGAGRGRGLRLRGAFLTLLLLLHAGAGLFAWAQDLTRPFSNAKQAAAFLAAGDFDDALWLGSADYAAQSITAWAVDRRIYYPQSGRFGSFVYWGKERAPSVTARSILETSISLLRSHGRPVVVILNFPLGPALEGPFALPPGVRFRSLARFEGAIVMSENYFLYLLDEPGRG